MLELLIYIENADYKDHDLIKEIGKINLNHKPVPCLNIDMLTSKLINRKGQQTVCLISLESKETLNEIQELNRRGLFRDIRVIIIIPNDDKDFLLNAFSLHPRYLTFKDTNYSDISKVLIKIKDNLPFISEKEFRQAAGC